jgi:hypothetical protein
VNDGHLTGMLDSQVGIIADKQVAQSRFVDCRINRKGVAVCRKDMPRGSPSELPNNVSESAV